MTGTQIDKWCRNCRYSEIFNCGDGFKILGCMHEPYHGKWVTEIDECPRPDRRANDGRE